MPDLGKRYIAKNVECPFYHSEDAQRLYCDGVQPGTAIHLAFGSKTDLKAYKAKFCLKNHHECRMAGMLYEKYQEEAD